MKSVAIIYHWLAFLCNYFWIKEYDRPYGCAGRIFDNFKAYMSILKNRCISYRIQTIWAVEYGML